MKTIISLDEKEVEQALIDYLFRSRGWRLKPNDLTIHMDENVIEVIISD